jgi:hypothetical protein
LCIVIGLAGAGALGGRQNPSLSKLQKACTDGEARGCFDLGLRYEDGSGVPKDERHAAALYEQACTGGEARGCRGLGLLYVEGERRDDARADGGLLPLLAGRAGPSHGLARGDALATPDPASPSLLGPFIALGRDAPLRSLPASLPVSTSAKPWRATTHQGNVLLGFDAREAGGGGEWEEAAEPAA